MKAISTQVSRRGQPDVSQLASATKAEQETAGLINISVSEWLILLLMASLVVWLFLSDSGTNGFIQASTPSDSQAPQIGAITRPGHQDSLASELSMSDCRYDDIRHTLYCPESASSEPLMLLTRERQTGAVIR